MPDAHETRGDLVLLTLAEGAARSVLRTAALVLGIPDAAIACACRAHGPRWVSVSLTRSCEMDALERVRRLPGVERAVALTPGLASRQVDATVTLRSGVTIGRHGPTIMAGPCSVESERQILEIAQAVKAAGADVLRGGAFKPRTSPYTFGGLGHAGIEMLALAGEQAGLPIVTEALQVDDLDVVTRFADVIQIGSRNMHNFPLLFRAGSHETAKPVLLKRGFNATLDELVQAAEYVLLGRAFGRSERPNLMLCERGIRTFETTTRFTLDVAAIPILHERTRLPVIADPSHAAGSRRWVPALARAACAAGADGLLLEVHPDPDRAWSDGAQSLTVEAFAELAAELMATRTPALLEAR